MKLPVRYIIKSRKKKFDMIMKKLRRTYDDKIQWVIYGYHNKYTNI